MSDYYTDPQGSGSYLSGGIQRGTPAQNSYDPSSWGGRAGVADADVSRYRAMGQAPHKAAVIDQTQSNGAREQQLYGLEQTQLGMNDMHGAMGDTRDAMGYAKQAADGSAPSAAQIYGSKLTDDGINSQMAMAASARGGPTAIGGAQRQAAFTGAQTQQAGARDMAALRAQEMAQGRDQYLGAAGQLGSQANAYGGLAQSYGGQAGAMRGQDLSAAAGQAQLNDADAARAQAGQQYYEGLGMQTNKAAGDQALHGYEAGHNYELGNKAELRAHTKDAWGRLQDTIGGVSSALGGMFSDERTKDNIYPLIPTGDRKAESPQNLALFESMGGAKFSGQPLGTYPTQQGPLMPEAQATAQWNRQYGDTSNAVDDARKHDNLAEASKIQARFQQDDAPSDQGGGAGGMLGKMFGGLAKSKMSGGSSGGASAAGAYMPSSISDERAKYIVSDERTKRHGEDPMAAANRAQQGSAYTYKPEFAAVSGQTPGEMNVGPMAQTMAENPVSATAVKQGPDGLYMLDEAKLSKLQSAGIASLQNQIDQLKSGRGRR